MSTTKVIEVTQADLDLIFAPFRQEWHCNVLLCGYITEIAADALHHMATEHQSELDFMAADLKAMQEGKRPTIYTYSNEALRTIERDVIGEIDYPF